MGKSFPLLWLRRACGPGFRRRGFRGIDLGSRECLPVITQRPPDDSVVPYQAWRWSRKTIALARNLTSAATVAAAEAGNWCLYPPLVHKLRVASFAVKGLDIGVREGDEGLLHVLRCEVEDCTKRSLNVTQMKPPKPFTLVKDEPGEMEITLTRIYGLEDITMSCVLQLVRGKHQRKPEVGEDSDSRKKMLQLTISVTKGDASPALKFRCECYRDGFAIHQVDLEYEDKEQTVYRPYFSNGKEEFVYNFQVFLYERGLNADLAGYIENHLERKRLLKSAAAFKKMTRFLEVKSSPEGRTGE